MKKVLFVIAVVMLLRVLAYAQSETSYLDRWVGTDQADVAFLESIGVDQADAGFL